VNLPYVLAALYIALTRRIVALGAGETTEEILRQYPSLDLDDIRACLQFAALLMDKRYDLSKVA